MTDLSLPPSGRTTRIPRAALRHYGAGANPRPAILLTPHYRLRGLMVRRWRLIGYFPIHLLPPSSSTLVGSQT